MKGEFHFWVNYFLNHNESVKVRNFCFYIATSDLHVSGCEIIYIIIINLLLCIREETVFHTDIL